MMSIWEVEARLQHIRDNLSDSEDIEAMDIAIKSVEVEKKVYVISDGRHVEFNSDMTYGDIFTDLFPDSEFGLASILISGRIVKVMTNTDDSIIIEKKIWDTIFREPIN